MRTLERGPVITYVTLRVVPGLWLNEVAEQVEKQMPGLTAAKFLAVAKSDVVRSKYEPANVHSLEGLLFPDTYKFTKDDREVDVARALVKRFDSVADSVGYDDPALVAKSAPGMTPYKLTVVASLVQEEAGIERDRPIISSVVYNRLRDDMLLQIDATVLYALQVRKPSNTEADRATDSRFNTYKYKGLPPTPIGSVGKASLRAALHPSTTNYLYYVLAGRDGHHAFAATYEGASEERRGGARGGPVAVSVTGYTHLAAVIGDPGAPLALARDAQRRVRGRRPRLALRRAPGRAGCGSARVRRDPSARDRRPERDDAAQGRCRRRVRRGARRRGAAAQRQLRVARPDGTLVGESTDGEGFVRSLREAGHDPAGVAALVLGAGGAARAVVLALAQAGARVMVAARRAEAAADAVALAPAISAVAWDAVGEAARSSDLIVNATPIGMGAAGSGRAAAQLPLAAADIGPGQVVADLVYLPRRTPLLDLAESRGAATVEGVGMLVHQGAIAFERWTATAAPVAVMRDAVLGALAARAPGS